MKTRNQSRNSKNVSTPTSNNRRGFVTPPSAKNGSTRTSNNNREFVTPPMLRSVKITKPTGDGDPLVDLYVRKVNPSTNEQDLRDVFECYGDIQKVRLMKNADGTSKCGLISFKNHESVGTAVAEFSKSNFQRDGTAWSVGRISKQLAKSALTANTVNMKLQKRLLVEAACTSTNNASQQAVDSNLSVCNRLSVEATCTSTKDAAKQSSDANLSVCNRVSVNDVAKQASADVAKKASDADVAKQASDANLNFFTKPSRASTRVATQKQPLPSKKLEEPVAPKELDVPVLSKNMKKKKALKMKRLDEMNDSTSLAKDVSYLSSQISSLMDWKTTLQVEVGNAESKLASLEDSERLVSLMSIVLSHVLRSTSVA